MSSTTTLAVPIPTREEVLAAPESDYMSPGQLAFFKDLLEKERDTLLSSAVETVMHLQDNPNTPDPSDRATQEEDHTLELRVRDRERKQLHRIESALLRIENGNYGWCQESGEPIGVARLMARPTATYSLEAQESHEAWSRVRGG